MDARVTKIMLPVSEESKELFEDAVNRGVAIRVAALRCTVCKKTTEELENKGINCPACGNPCIPVTGYRYYKGDVKVIPLD